MEEGKSGTLVVTNEEQKSLLGFLPVEELEGCYLITMIPRTVLQEEATPIIIMLCGMFCLLLLGGISIAVLQSGRQSMKADVEQKEYREKLFGNLSANIDFAFLLYTPDRQKVELVSDNLPSLIANLVTFMKPEMDKKNQSLRMKSQILEHDTVISDGLYLQKILLNLLSNAVKYTQESGEVSLQITETPMDEETIWIRFAVEDNGIGMSPEFLERVFNPFERAEDSRMSQVTGTGLGLAIKKELWI